MRRALAAVAIVAMLTLSGCAQRYDTPDERSHAFGNTVAESVRGVEPQPASVRIRGSFSGITMEARLDDMSFPDTRDFLEGALSAVAESPLGALPVLITLSHDDAPSGVGALEWRGYDPARADQYFAAVQLWLDLLADSDVQVAERFDVEAASVSASVNVFDDRDLTEYRAELVGVLESAGYAEPRISVVAASRP